jgi:hypothetical protein
MSSKVIIEDGDISYFSIPPPHSRVSEGGGTAKQEVKKGVFKKMLLKSELEQGFLYIILLRSLGFKVL